MSDSIRRELEHYEHFGPSAQLLSAMCSIEANYSEMLKKHSCLRHALTQLRMVQTLFDTVMAQEGTLYTPKMPKILCAANRRRSDDALLVGPRHWDATMAHQLGFLPVSAATNSVWEQGFIDHNGVFYTRTEAWQIAEKAGQINRRVGGDTANGGTLYPENLY